MLTVAITLCSSSGAAERITYTLKRDARTSLAAYDAAGVQVRTLMSGGFEPPGSASANTQGRNEQKKTANTLATTTSGLPANRSERPPNAGGKSADQLRAVRSDDGRILVETDCLTAEVWPNGYVSGVKANTFIDRRTGARDNSFGLDIVDFLMGSGAEGGLPYRFGNKIHGDIAKHYIELPQICTGAKHINSEFVVGRDFVAVRQWWKWTEAAPGYTPGSLWEQTIVFPMGRRYFISCDSVESANAVDELFLRIDMPGHVKHNRGDTFEQIYLSYEGRIPAGGFFEDFAPDNSHFYQRDTHPLPQRMIRAHKIRGEGMPWLAGMTLDPGMVSEAWCHQRRYVCLIQEIGGLPVKPGDRFAASYIVGYFNSVKEMETEYDLYRGFTSLAATKDYWLLSEGVIVQEQANRFQIVPQGRRPEPRRWRVLVHGQGQAVVNGHPIEINGEHIVEVPARK